MEAQLQFDAGGGCPLYGSASHGLPNEQLGHQWRFAMVLAWGVPRTQRQWNLLHLGFGEQQRAQGWVSQAPVGAAPKPGFMGLVAAPSPGSADRALGSLGCQTRCPVVKRTGSLGNPFPAMWGQLLCSIALALWVGRRKVLL